MIQDTPYNKAQQIIDETLLILHAGEANTEVLRASVLFTISTVMRAVDSSLEGTKHSQYLIYWLDVLNHAKEIIALEHND